MKNIEMTVEGNTLIIRVKLDKTFGQSKSGNSIKIASTDGNISIPGHDNIRVGLNVYKPNN